MKQFLQKRNLVSNNSYDRISVRNILGKFCALNDNHIFEQLKNKECELFSVKIKPWNSIKNNNSKKGGCEPPFWPTTYNKLKH